MSNRYFTHRFIYRSAAACSLLFLASCREPAVEPPHLLTSKTWQRGLTDNNPASNPPGQNMYFPVPDCEKDDTFRFRPDGVLEINHGTQRCSASEPAREEIPYTLNRSTKELTMRGMKYLLAEESKTQVKYYRYVASGNGFSNLIYLLQ